MTSHINVTQALAALGEGRAGAAESLYRQGLGIKRRMLGAEHVQVAHSLNNLGICYAEVGQPERAEDMLR